MNKKIESIKGLIIWILSRSIVFNVSDVNGFADIAFGKAKKLKLKDIRFSLVSIGLGYSKLCIISIAHKQFKFIKILKFEHDIHQIDKKATSDQNKYQLTMVGKDEVELEIELDFIKYKLGQSQSVINTTEFKMNFYFVFLIFIMTTILQQYEVLTNGLLHGSLISQIALWGFLYSLINCVLIILEYFKVKDFYRSMFKEIKKSK